VGSTFTTDTAIERELRVLTQELSLTGQVAFTGELPNAEGMMRAADVVVVPSTKPEPFGKVLVEAMFLAKPVIATTPGGPAEIIRDGVEGILVDPGAVAELALALIRLTDRETRDRLGANGVLRAKGFSHQTSANKYADLILTAG
jgi:glycosyltransferase involved in cell wall biosynthesis